MGRGIVLCRIFREKESSADADVRTFLVKTLGFFEIYGVSERTRGTIFHDFVRTSAMDDPLMLLWDIYFRCKNDTDFSK